MENFDPLEIINFIRVTANAVSPEMSSLELKEIEHYLNHDEYEMAFEGLFLSIMKSKKKFKIDIGTARKIAIELNLNIESVFDDGFWKKFESYLSNQ